MERARRCGRAPTSADKTSDYRHSLLHMCSLRRVVPPACESDSAQPNGPRMVESGFRCPTRHRNTEFPVQRIAPRLGGDITRNGDLPLASCGDESLPGFGEKLAPRWCRTVPDSQDSPDQDDGTPPWRFRSKGERAGGRLPTGRSRRAASSRIWSRSPAWQHRLGFMRSGRSLSRRAPGRSRRRHERPSDHDRR